MNDERQKTRVILAWSAGVSGWLLVIVVSLAMLSTKRAARNEAADFGKMLAASQAGHESQQAELESQSKAASLALRSATERLAPFVAHAARLFPDGSPAAQLDKLRDFILASEIAAKRLSVLPVSFNKLRTMLKDATAFEVEVSAMMGSPEALALAAEFRLLFESAGLKVRKVAGHASAPERLGGVVIASKPQFDESLGEIVRELCAAVAQEKIQWVKEATGFNARDADVKIYVSPR